MHSTQTTGRLVRLGWLSLTIAAGWLFAVIFWWWQAEWSRLAVWQVLALPTAFVGWGISWLTFRARVAAPAGHAGEPLGKWSGEWVGVAILLALGLVGVGETISFYRQIQRQLLATAHQTQPMFPLVPATGTEPQTPPLPAAFTTQMEPALVPSVTPVSPRPTSSLTPNGPLVYTTFWQMLPTSCWQRLGWMLGELCLAGFVLSQTLFWFAKPNATHQSGAIQA